jgi:recombination protein RecT
MSNQLATINTQAVVGSFTQAELETLKATIAKGTTNEQFALFVQTCVRSGLNPFLNQIFCQVYNTKDGPVMSIQIAVEGIVALAKRHPQYKGFIASEVKQNDEFYADVAAGTVEHKIKSLDRGQTVGAYCVAYREGAPNILVMVTIDQVQHLIKSEKGAQARMWKDYLDDMIVKHAIKRAFKRQFGIEVAEDEYGNAGAEIPAYEPPARRDITDEVNAATAANSLPEPQDRPAPQQANDEAAKMDELKKQMTEKFRVLGINGREARAQYIASKNIVQGETPTIQELTKLLKLMDIDIQQKQAQAAVDDDDLL